MTDDEVSATSIRLVIELVILSTCYGMKTYKFHSSVAELVILSMCVCMVVTIHSVATRRIYLQSRNDPFAHIRPQTKAPRHITDETIGSHEAWEIENPLVPPPEPPEYWRTALHISLFLALCSMGMAAIYFLGWSREVNTCATSYFT